MKNFYLSVRKILFPAQIRLMLAGMATAFVVAALPGKLFAQSPSINYSSPQTFVVGTAITPVSPVNTGGAVASLHFNSSSSTVSTGVNDATCVAFDKSGNMYIGESSGTVSVLASGGSSATVLATGFTSSPILSIAVDQSGIVYLADGSAVWKIPATGGRTPVVIDHFYGPTSVAVDPAGDIYVADSNEAEVLDSNGGLIRNIGEADMLLITADQNGIVFFYDSNGNIFEGGPGHIGNDLLGNTSAAAITTDASGNFYTVTNDGQLFITPQNGAASISQGPFPVITGMAVDANFNIYGALNGNVIKISASGGYFTNPELPFGLSIDGNTGVISGTPSGTSAATDYKVTAFNASGSSTATVNITVNPMAPAISYSSPQLYQVGTAIGALSPASSRVASWGYSASTTTVSSGVGAPVDVAADAEGNIYAVEFNGNEVVKIPAGGGAAVVLSSGFNGPFGIALDGSGNVYVADAGNNAVKEIVAGSGAVNIIGSGFNGPTAVAVDAAGNVYVGDTGNGALKEIPAGGGTPVTLQSGFATIQGVAVDAAGNIYVADAGVGTSGNGAVYKVPAGGGSMVSVGTGFARPAAVAVDAGGNLYVTDISKSVVTIIEPGGTQFTAGSGFDHANGVTFDTSGNLYVADAGSGTIKEVKITGGYFLSAFLPAGLSFDNNTGIISGTPSVASATATYTITGWNITGSAAATLSITVGAPIINYTSPVAYATGAAITPLTPSVAGGAVGAFGFNTTATGVNTGVSDAVSLAMDQSGNLYIGEGSGNISRLLAGASAATVFATGFTGAWSVALDASNNVLVADGTHVWKIPAGGGTAISLGSFHSPVGLAIDAAGSIYVADNAGVTGGVFKMNSDGTGQTRIDNNLPQPAYIALDNNGNLFIGDQTAQALYEIPAGGVQKQLASGFGVIVSVKTDLSGNVYIGGRSGGIYCYSAGSGLTNIDPVPTNGLMTDANFNLYYASFNDGKVYKISPRGGYFTNPQLPNGLTIDANTGTISGTPANASAAANYTVNAFNAYGSAPDTVIITVGPAPAISYSTPQTYIQGSTITPLLPSSTGAPISGLGFSTSITLSTGLSDANCMAMDKNGNIYIGESSGKVSKLAAGASSATVYATGFATVNSFDTEGITVDTSGNVYFADFHSVWKIPAGGGTPLTLGSFGAPGGVALDAAGNVYVADLSGSGGVFKMAADGTGQTRIGRPAEATNIAVDNNGNVFIVDGLLDELYEIPAGGTLKSLKNLGQPSCVTVDAAGNVYIGQPGGYGLQFLSAGGGSLFGIGPSLSGEVTGIMVDPNFNLYVANNGIIKKITASSGYFISPELPNGLTIDPTSGAISGKPTTVSPAANYTVTAFSNSVSSTANVNITVNPSAPTISYSTPKVFAQNAAITPLVPVSTNVGSPGYLGTASTAGSFAQPFATAVDQSGNVYVADKSANSLYELLAGGGQTTVGTGLNTPAGVAVDKSGNVYAVSQGDKTVVKIQAHTGTQTLVGSGYQFPTAVAVDSAGNVFVTDVQGAAGVVYKVAPGQNKQIFTSGFTSPNGIAVDAAGNVYVSDFGGGATPSMVYKISPDGGAKTPLNQSFTTATGLAIDATGNLFVVDGGNLDVVEFPAGGGSAVTITAGFSFPFAASADGAGNLYVADPGANKVVKLTPAGGYFINRVLPAGLGFNTTTGAISGTSTAVSPATDYTVTAYNFLGVSGMATVNIKVPSSTNANLTNLTLNHNATFTPTFAPGQLSYTANVPYTTNEISITPACDTTATVKVNNTAVTSGIHSQRFLLGVGNNTLTIVVTAQDSTTTKTYTVIVNRAASPNAYLSNLRLNGQTMSPAFNYTTTSYTAHMPYPAASVKVTPTSADAGATIKVNNVPVASHASSTIALNVGDNAIAVTVTAADGVSTKTYTITVTRAAPPADANLSNLRINGQTISPAFNYTVTAYRSNVSNATSAVNVIPTAHDPAATVTINGNPFSKAAPSGPVALAAGDNIITIVVTAAGGVTTKTYTITVTREAGSIAEPLAAISVEKPIESSRLAGDDIIVHQGVSPNGDGQNDYLVIDGIGNYPDNKLVIMNRSGALVYEAKGYDNSTQVFDGHSNKTGAKQLPGTYFYSLEYKSGNIIKHKTGFIVLKY